MTATGDASITRRRTWTRVTAPLLLTRASGQALEFAGWIVLARRLGTSSFGSLSVAFLVCRYAGLVADWGASLQGPRDVAAAVGRDRLDALVRQRLVVAAGLMAAFAGGTRLLGVTALAPLAMTILARGIGRDWVALGQGRGLRSGLPATLQGVALAALTLTLVHTTVVAAVVIGASYLGAGLLSAALNPLPRSTAGVAQHVAQRRPQAWLLVTLFADQIAATMDTILLAVLRSASAAGVYAAVYRIPNAWITVLGLMIAAMVPVSTRALTENPARLLATTQRALRLGAMAGLGLAVLAPLSYLVVPVVFGHAYDAGRLPLAILLVATGITTAATPVQPLYLALGRDRDLARTYAISGAASLVFDVALIPALSTVGGALATLLTQACIAVLLLRPLRSIAFSVST